jgi:hypothetical protein
MVARFSRTGLQPRALIVAFCRGECERHRSFDDNLIVDPREALEHAHAAAESHHDGLKHDNFPGMNRAAVTHTLDAREERQALAVFRLRQNQYSPHLRNRLCENGGRQCGRPSSGRVRQMTHASYLTDVETSRNRRL